MVVRVKVGRARGASTAARVNAAIAKATAQETIDRVRNRTRPYDAAARTWRVKGVNQYRADIIGSRGGPGVIVPKRAKALRFHWKKLGKTVTFNKVFGVGLEPLAESEAKKIDTVDVDGVF